jgi:hypothetical protein
VYGPSGVAAKLGIPRSTLETKIRSLKINKNRFCSRLKTPAFLCTSFLGRLPTSVTLYRIHQLADAVNFCVRQWHCF